MIDTENYFGTPLETYSDVQTEDGYILTLKRIPVSSTTDWHLETATKNENYSGITRSKPAVLVLHGLHTTGSGWLLNRVEKTLPHKLAIAGYDCWLGSNRGTHLSRGHITLSTKSRKYWDFCVDDLAMYDIPAMIDYILSVTGQEKLYFIGHSLACSQIVVTMNLKPEYNSKIEMVAAVCPVVYSKHLTDMGIKIQCYIGARLGKSKTFYLTAGELYPKTCYEYAKRVCTCLPFLKRDKVAVWMVKKTGKLGNAFGGTDQIEKERYLTLSKHFPGPLPMKIYCHVAQCFAQMQQYDYGPSKNLKKYGRSKPMAYDVKNVTCPVATFCSDHDVLVRPKDVEQFAKDLPNLVEHHEVRHHTKFQHGDFMLSKDADILVYDKIIDIFNKSLKITSKL